MSNYSRRKLQKIWPVFIATSNRALVAQQYLPVFGKYRYCCREFPITWVTKTVRVESVIRRLAVIVAPALANSREVCTFALTNSRQFLVHRDCIPTYQIDKMSMR